MADGALRRQRLALTSLVMSLPAIAQLFALAIVGFPRATFAILVVAVGFASAWYGVRRRGAIHVIALILGGMLFVACVAWMIAQWPGLAISTMVAIGVCILAATGAFRVHETLPAARRPVHPVVIWNPRSGAGKAARAHLDEEARARGIAAIELTPGTNLERVVTEALDNGADAIAVAGGDGSQATAARIASERNVPYACIPAGTRNHFALDLGVDRDDVVGALDALVDGGERRIDLGEVNGHTFVNNVSIGVYGEAVQRATYRDSKVRTFLEAIPRVLGPHARPALRWRDSAGELHAGAAAIVVSNNRYQLGGGSASRPRLDEGLLGVTVLALPGDEPGMRSWTATTYELDAPGSVHAGIDGEAVILEPPLRFRIRPGALTCRIARAHPGASPSAMSPAGLLDAVRMLGGLAFARRGRTRDCRRGGVTVRSPRL